MWKTLRIGALDINGNSHDAMMMMTIKYKNNYDAVIKPLN